jgi:hypothetical protein
MAVQKPARKTSRGVNRFVANLGGVQLPEGAADELERGIRKAVLSAVATLDFKGDLRLEAPSRLEGLTTLLGPTRGIRIAISKPNL